MTANSPFGSPNNPASLIDRMIGDEYETIKAAVEAIPQFAEVIQKVTELTNFAAFQAALTSAVNAAANSANNAASAQAAAAALQALVIAYRDEAQDAASAAALTEAIVTAAQSAAASSQVAAAGSASSALAHKNAAEASALLAQKWATETVTEVTPGGGFGAARYAYDAAAKADEAADSAAAAAQSALDAAAIVGIGSEGTEMVSRKGQPNGYPSLDANAKIPAAQIPDEALSRPLLAANQSAMLALSAQRGDVCIRTDLSKSFMLSTNSPGTLADWIELLTPVIGIVDVTGLTSALAAKANVVNPSFTGVGTLVNASGQATFSLVGDDNDAAFAPTTYGLSRAPRFVGQRARGTLDAPLAVASGDGLLFVEGAGRDSSGAMTIGSRIRSVVSGTVSSGCVPATLEFFTTPAGGVLTSRMVIGSDGIMTINGAGSLGQVNIRSASATAGLALDNPTGTEKLYFWSRASAGNAQMSSVDANLFLGTAGAHELNLITNSLTRMKITSAGIVTVNGSGAGAHFAVRSADGVAGIGTDNSAGSEVLNLWSRVSAGNAQIASSNANLYLAAFGANSIHLSTNGSSRLHVRSDGLVTINGATANGVLSVRTGRASIGMWLDTPDGENLRLYPGVSGGIAQVSTNGNTLNLGTETAHDLRFMTGGSMRGYISGDGLTVVFTGVANTTTGSAGNVYVDAGTGRLYRSTSGRKYKTDIQPYVPVGSIDDLDPKFYRSANDPYGPVFAGFIAEDVHEANFNEFVVYDANGDPDALHYPNMVALLVYEIKQLRQRVAALEALPAAA